MVISGLTLVGGGEFLIRALSEVAHSHCVGVHIFRMKAMKGKRAGAATLMGHIESVINPI